jgi:hypothetical protein
MAPSSIIRAAPSAPLLGGLEEELYVAPRRAVRAEERRGAEEHGGMRVMPAHVPDPRDP